MWTRRRLARYFGTWHAALAGRRGITLTGAVIGGLGIFFTSSPYALPPNYPSLDEYPLGWMLISIVAATAVLGAGWLVRRWVRTRLAFWLTLTTFAVAGVMRVVIERLAPHSFEFDLGIFVAVMLAAISAVAWFGMPAVVLTGLDLFRSARARLSEEQRQLEQVRSNGRHLVEELASECAPDRAGDISSDLRSFGAQAADLAAGTFANSEPDAAAFHRLAARLREYSAQVVRVVSHDMSDRIDTQLRLSVIDGPAKAVGNAGGPADRSGMGGSTVAALVTVGSFAPAPTAAFGLLVFMTAASGAVGPVHGLRGSVTAALALFVMLSVADRLVGRRGLTWSVATRGVVAVGVYVLVAALVASLVAVLLVPGLDGRRAVVWVSSGFVGTMMICLVGGAMGATGRLGNLNLEIRAAVAALSWETARTRARLGELRDWVVHVLHGDVQSRLVASAAQLDLAVDGGGPRNRQAISAGEVAMVVAAGLDSAVGELAEPGRANSPGVGAEGVLKGIGAIAAEWDPMLVIETLVSPADAREIDGHGDSAEDVVRVVREAAGNAYRHGAASRLIVAIKVEEPWIRLCVDDDGIGPGDGLKRGLGLGGMAATAGRVRLGPGPVRGCRLEVDIPMG